MLAGSHWHGLDKSGEKRGKIRDHLQSLWGTKTFCLGLTWLFQQKEWLHLKPLERLKTVLSQRNSVLLMTIQLIWSYFREPGAHSMIAFVKINIPIPGRWDWLESLQLCWSKVTVQAETFFFLQQILINLKSLCDRRRNQEPRGFFPFS